MIGRFDEVVFQDGDASASQVVTPGSDPHGVDELTVIRTAEMPGPTCHVDGCTAPVTLQSHREATEQESLHYFGALDDHRRTLGPGFEPFPPDAAIRQVPVTVAVYHCTDHVPQP